MGSPVVYSGRVMAYSNPEQAWQHTGSSKLVLNGVKPRVGAVISILQYTLAIGSVANIFTLIIEICARSITIFDCVNFFKPIIWVAFPIVIHLMGTVPYLIGSKRSGNLYVSPWLPVDPDLHFQNSPLGSRKKTTSLPKEDSLQIPALQSFLARFFRRIKRHIVIEMTISACRPPVSLSSNTKDPLWCIFFNSTASLVGLVCII
ncbi:hypothetical protein MMC34_008225 [Xylographa carneopallida]|nr:hypothetical protein [Xylographa carneopallida]